MSKEIAKGILSEELDALRKRIINNHISAKQRASGYTENSMRVEVTDNEGTLFGRKYFGTLETGRKAGNVPKGFNEIIQEWIINKGISITPIPYERLPSDSWQPKYTPEQRGLMSLSGAIAHKIKTEGTQLFRESGRTDIYSNEIEKTISIIHNRLFGIFKKDIDTIHLNSKKDEEYND